MGDFNYTFYVKDFKVDSVVHTFYPEHTDAVLKEVLQNYKLKGSREYYDTPQQFNPYTNFGAKDYVLPEEVKEGILARAKHVLVGYTPGRNCAIKDVEYWWAVYDEGAVHDTHNHAHGADMCAVWVLTDSPDSSTVFLGNQLISKLDKEPMGKISIPSGRGALVFFPSGLIHYTTPSSKQRAVIAFNFTVEDL